MRGSLRVQKRGYVILKPVATTGFKEGKDPFYFEPEAAGPEAVLRPVKI